MSLSIVDIVNLYLWEDVARAVVHLIHRSKVCPPMYSVLYLLSEEVSGVHMLESQLRGRGLRQITPCDRSE